MKDSLYCCYLPFAQGPGRYMPEAHVTALSTHRAPLRAGIGGKLDNVDRMKSGPFGRAYASGSMPGPGQYLSQAPKLLARAPVASFSNTSRDTIAKVCA